MSEQRGNWYLLTGSILGLVLGLLISWVLIPVRYIDTNPASLADSYKDDYRRAVALSYQSNRDLGRARERLLLLNQDGATQILAAQAQRMLAENQSPQEARAIAVLAADLGRPANAQEPTASPETRAEITNQSPTPENTETLTPTEEGVVAAIQTATQPLPTRIPTITRTSIPTNTPMPTFTPRPTATPIRILDAPFVLKEKKEICDGSIPPGLLQVYITGADGNPLPGVRVVVTWEGGEDVFYTGLKPEMGAGYGDYLMAEQVSYRLKVGEVSDEVKQQNNRTECAWQIEYTMIKKE
jgi:hypothetical protein